jgi:hypothetical protein
VIARSASDEAIQSGVRLAMDCFAEPVVEGALRRPVARNDVGYFRGLMS